MHSVWLQKVPRIIIAFIASVALTATGLLICLKMTLFSQEFMIHQATQSDYVALTTKDINEYIQDNARGSNIPPEIMEDIVSEKQVDKNLKSFIRAIYTDVPFRLTGESELRQTIQQKIDTYASEKGITIDEEAQKNIANLIDQNILVFTKYVEIPTFKHYAKQVMLYNSKLTLLISITMIVDIILLAALWMISGRYLHHKIRYFAYTFGGAALMLLVLPTIIYFSGKIERIAVHSKALYQFFTTYLNHILLTVILSGGILLVLSAIFVGISALFRKRLVKRR